MYDGFIALFAQNQKRTACIVLHWAQSPAKQVGTDPAESGRCQGKTPGSVKQFCLQDGVKSIQAAQAASPALPTGVGTAQGNSAQRNRVRGDKGECTSQNCPRTVPALLPVIRYYRFITKWASTEL